MLSTITARLTEKNDDYIASITGGMGVIDKNTGELRSTMDILKDLSKAWEGLTSVEKQELTETVAGKTQRALFTALMQNFQTAVDATSDALNSENSAAEENEKRMDSLNGKVQKLQSAWQNFARNTINSDFVKNILEAGTGLIKFADAAGGLAPLLVTIGSSLAIFKAGSLAKGIFEISDKFSKFKKTVSDLGGGFKAFQLALSGVKNAEDAAKISTLGFATAAQTLTTALGVIGVAVGIATAAYNLYTNAQNEARENAIEGTKTNQEAADSLQERIQKEEDAVKSLNEEKKSLSENNSQKKDTSGNDAQIQALDDEIKKRNENITKMKEETKEKLNAAATSAEQYKYQKPTESWTNPFAVTTTEAEKKEMKALDEQLKQNNSTVGEYYNSLQKLNTYYRNLRDGIGENKTSLSGLSLTTEEYNTILEVINKRIEDNKKAYEQDKEAAEAAYNVLLNSNEKGIKLNEDTIDSIKKVLNLTDEDIEKVKEGTDVKKTDAEATKKQTEALSEQKQELEKAKKNVQTTSKSLDNMQKSYNNLSTAVDEYNSNGYLSVDTLQSLLGMSDEYLSALSMENGQLVLNTTALDQKTDALVAAKVQEMQAAAIADIYALSQGNVNKMSTLAQTAIKNVGTDAVNTGANFASAVSDINKFTTAILQAKAAAGDKATVENFDQKANAIISSYQNLYKNVTSLGRGTTRSGGLSRGGGHRYTGKSTGKKSGSGSKSSTKSTKEEYKATIDTLYKYKNALNNAKDSVDKLQDALKNTDNYNEQEKYIKQLIAALDEEIKKTQDLKNAQSNQINDYINQLRKQGFAIDYNASKNELYIKNMEHLGDLSGDNAKATEKLLDKIQDLNDNNRNLDSSIRDLKKDTKDYYKQLADIPEAKLKKFNELMKEFQQGRLDQIQNEIDDIEHEMKNDPRLQQLEKQIEALEKQNDEVDKQKNLEEKLLAIEEAKEKLANARNQKTLQVYRKGQGFVWEADPTAIKEAQDELDSAQSDLDEQQKQDQIDDLKAEKEAIEKGYQDKIDALQKFLDEQNYQIDKAGREEIQTLDQMRQELAKYGLDSAEYLGKATDWLNKYNSALKETKGTLDTISSSSATDGTLYSSSSQNRLELAKSALRFKSILSDISSASSKMAYDKLSGGNNQSVYINNVELPNVKDANEFVEALKNLPRLAASQATMRT